MPTSPRFDLTRVTLRHYRSIRSCDVKLGPLNLLVGPNGAGKSNFLDSLRFVSQALTETLDHAIRDRGGIGEVRRRSTGHPTHFGIGLEFCHPEFVGSYKFQIAAVKGGDYRVSHEDLEIKPYQFGVDRHFYSVRDGKVVDTSEFTAMPAPAEDRLFLVSASGLEPFRAAFDGLSAMQVFNLNPLGMRQPQQADSGDVLRRDGSNIASVLERLKREKPEVKERVEEYLQIIVDGVFGADRRAIDRWEQVEFRQRVSGSESPWKFPASSMSDGTLRALGVLVALFAPSDGVYSTIGVEEPESALHPAAAALLLEALQDASEQRQILATTHSPDLLDSKVIAADEILGVRAVDGNTEIGSLDAVGVTALRDGLYTPGELLRLDQLQPERPSGQLDLFS